jgi:hypothetical protein
MVSIVLGCRCTSVREIPGGMGLVKAKFVGEDLQDYSKASVILDYKSVKVGHIYKITVVEQA